MDVAAESSGAGGNNLLARLPAAELALVRPLMQPVALTLSDRLHRAGEPLRHLYFSGSGLISLTAETGDGNLVEVGMTGREGLIGVQALLNPRPFVIHPALVQVAGHAWRVDAQDFRAALRDAPVLHGLCLRHLQATLVQAAQAAACNARHELPARLARWLLMTRDRTDSDDVPMTQEFISYMLGVRRAGVSVVLNLLQERGLLRQGRGRVTLLDRPGLEAQACTCYRIIKDAHQRIMSE